MVKDPKFSFSMVIMYVTIFFTSRGPLPIEIVELNSYYYYFIVPFYFILFLNYKLRKESQLNAKNKDENSENQKNPWLQKITGKKKLMRKKTFIMIF